MNLMLVTIFIFVGIGLLPSHLSRRHQFGIASVATTMTILYILFSTRLM
jgi:hypothetical protein